MAVIVTAELKVNEYIEKRVRSENKKGFSLASAKCPYTIFYTNVSLTFCVSESHI